MVKSDDLMARVRQRLLDEDAQIKASEQARKQREAKKFGKKVQVEKLQERQKKKSEDLEKIKSMKKS
jgi:rRNA-processing protein EBP2